MVTRGAGPSSGSLVAPSALLRLPLADVSTVSTLKLGLFGSW